MNTNAIFNRLPGLNFVSNKKHFALLFRRLMRVYGCEFDFSPHTFLLPHDRQALMMAMKQHKDKTIILKPESGAEGNGILLVKDYKSIPNIAFQKPYIAQEYIEEPYVLDNKKFDLRIYVMVTSLGSGTSGDDPITAFIADEGMVRFCTEDY